MFNMPLSRPYTHAEGVELDQAIKRRMRAEEKKGNTTYSYAQAWADELAEQKQQQQTRSYAQSDTPTLDESYRSLGAMIAAAKSGGFIDVNLALAQLKNVEPDLLYNASQLKLDALVHDWIHNEGLAGPTNDHLQAAYRAVLDQFPGIALAYGSRGTRFDETTIKQLYPQFFK